MRPDERLLVPVECLPFVPSGLPMWDDEFGAACVAGALADPPHLHGCGLLADLPAPALRDGVPERVDALPWALGVIAKRNGLRVPLRVVVIDDPGRWPRAALQYEEREARASIGPRTRYGSHHIDLTPWPDLSGLSPDEAARAVVAAALRQRGGK